MNKQYKDSITSQSAGYMKEPANEIGSYECNEGSSAANNYGDVNSAFVVSAVPNSENSKRKSDVSQLTPGLDSPGKVGDSSC